MVGPADVGVSGVSVASSRTNSSVGYSGEQGLNQHRLSERNLLVKLGTRLQRICFVFLRPESAEAHINDPRKTPGYQLHRALSTLNSHDIEQLDSPDRERIVEVTMLLEQVGLLTRPGASEKTNTKTES